jgi:glycine hydroxymethyltransferase
MVSKKTGVIMLLNKYLKSTLQDDLKYDTIAYLAALDHINLSFPLVSKTIIDELRSQRSNLKLIASENYSSLAVQLAMGNLLTDKYAEGYPNHRFYAGCNNVDILENEAIHQLKKLFDCQYAFVQPHSGADANIIAFFSILIDRIQNKEIEKLKAKGLDDLKPDEIEKIRQLMMNQKLLGMSLNSGGHLTHGFKHNLSSKIMQAVNYEVDPKTELLNYDSIKKIALREKPLILLAGYSAYPRKIDFAKMREIADASNSVLMVDMAHFSGLVAGKAFINEFNPIPYAHIITSTTHKTLRGPRGGIILSSKELGMTIDKACPLVMGGPLPHVIAAKAIAFKEANEPSFEIYAQNIIKNAKALANTFLENEVRVTTNGTDNHLLIVDVSQFGINGRQAEIALRQASITVNRNTIPFDLNGSWYTSGIRLGTAALTTLGMKEGEMKEIASIIIDVLKHTKPDPDSRGKCFIDPSVVDKSCIRVKDLLSKFPLYPEIKLD